MSRAITVFNFFYNNLLIIVFTAVLSFAVCLYLLRKRKVAIPIIGLYICYLVDTLIIFMTESLDGFTKWYNEGFGYSPAIKTIIFIAIGFFTIFTWNVLMNRPFTVVQAMILIALGMYQLLIPLMENSSLRSWLFFLSYQVFSIVISIYGLWRLGHMGENDSMDFPKWMRALLIVTIAFSLLIIAEDTIVIFKFDQYTGNNIQIYNRSISEDILRLVYTGFFGSIFFKHFRLTWMTAPETTKNVLSFERPGRKENNSEVTPDADVEFSGGDNQPAETVQAGGYETTSRVDTEEYVQMKFIKEKELTGREGEILKLMVSGQSNQEISDTLHISMGTVKAHIHNIFQKTDVTHRYELLRIYDAFYKTEIEKAGLESGA